MAWTAPSTWVAGAILTAAQLNTQLRDNLLTLGNTAWVAVASTTCTQSGAITLSNSYNRYMQIGKTVVWSFQCSYSSGTGTSANSLTITPPVAPVSSSSQNLGSGVIYDSSATTAYPGSWISVGASTCQFRGLSTQNAFWGYAPSVAFTTGDTLGGVLIYEVA